MTEKEHEVHLHFLAETSNTRTAIECKCGESCGSVVTGTRLPVIMEIYRQHIQKDPHDS